MSDRVSVFRLAVAGALSLAILFILCWLAAALWPVGPSHMFVALFTSAPVNSLVALAIGGVVTVISGAIGGALFAWTYNLTARNI